MQNFPHVLSEYEDINSALYKPINSTQRIKYTCFNTSSNYIILGSTSGSVYLFSREPCSFLQLIPLSEGAVSQVLISPDEKTIALATMRGSVCLVAMKPTPKLIAVSTEHVYEQINCLCWSDNSSEIYVGDGAGKVSVMVLTIFTVNGMFQAPACTLMNLDSAIVQLSFSTPLLLVSSLSRCYICDTVQEQYKQIGNKARNGEFGACFFKTYLNENNAAGVIPHDEKLANRKRSFSFIPEGDSNVQGENHAKIFCARPGSRLWVVSASGVVMKTHQFKEALAVAPAVICKPNARKTSSEGDTRETWSPQSANFSHLFVLAEKYLFSYTSSGLYVLDPASATVLLWSNEFVNINMAETVDNRIYLMTSDGEFRCLVLNSLNGLVVRLYGKKRYYECLEACLLYKVQLEAFIDGSEVRKICDIESKLDVLRDEELSTMLHPLILLLQSNLDTSPKKLESGIVVVHSGNSDFKDEENFQYKSGINASRSTDSSQGTEKESENSMRSFGEDSPIEITKETDDSNHDRRKSLQVEETNDEEEFNENSATDAVSRSNQNIMRRVQCDLECIYRLAGNIKPLTTEGELERIIHDINDKLFTIRDSYEILTELKSFVYEVLRSAELYYFSTLLENTSSRLISSTSSHNILEQFEKAFVDVNAHNSRGCACGGTFPVNQTVEPKFLRIGRSLLRKYLELNKEECARLCNRVPYMWRDYLPICIEQQNVPNDSIIRQCLQTRDNTVLSLLLPSLDGDQWNLAVKCLTQIKEGNCIFCEKSGNIETREPLIDWSCVAREITKKHGPDVAIDFLTKLEDALPDVGIDKSIFQSLVFTKIMYQHGMKCTMDFNNSTLGSAECNTMCSTTVRDQLIQVLEKDLGRPINKSIFGSGAYHWGMRYRNKASTCPCCTLALQTPVLLGNNGIAIFCCGHAYHVNCMIENKLTTCNLH